MLCDASLCGRASIFVQARSHILAGLCFVAEVDLEGAREVACTTDLLGVVALLRDVEADSENRALALRLLGILVSFNDAVTQVWWCVFVIRSSQSIPLYPAGCC